MNYIQRLKLELQSITLDDTTLTIYLQENNIQSPELDYNPSLFTDKLAILQTTLAILESIANDPQLMKNYTEEGTTVQGFADALRKRIDQLESKIRTLLINNDTNNSTFMLF
ncbi:hypothetical protein GMB86_11910 [Terrilactibacillus sp. BCM23-1]|uniref:Uncharacterized protein n=1 Tax=Terrilactibacillus tamarindi TaxID=2599694 RepID=A0A6N8CRA7_9BACI|nr:hypothetical protein [Terrilactibacillus tamarindi]MTT32712.1 hypothetical protein [Terrilactibacillus tamarindi]